MATFSRVAGATAFVLAGILPASAQQAIQSRPGEPISGLTPAQLSRFVLGKAAFDHIQDVSEGLGPVMNDTSCEHCHFGPSSGGSSGKNVTRFGVAAVGPNPFDPLDNLGGSLQQALFNPGVPPEAIPLQANVVIQRITPPCFGFGLVEAIADADIQARELMPPPGVSGKAHIVTPAETPLGPPRVGRFGWKAQVATVLTFSGDAGQNELGLSNRLFPVDNQSNGPAVAFPGGAFDTVPDPEDGPDVQGFHKIDRMTDFQRFLSPPPQTPRHGMTGETIFNSIGCASCHVSTPYTTGVVAEAALSNRTLKPYSDFLLHDMGGLGDGIPQGMATETEFRTAPLWGVGLRAPVALLHDGRAAGLNSIEDNIDAAIVAHAGEAAASAANYAALNVTDKGLLYKFLLSLGRLEFDVEYNNNVNELDWFFIRPTLTGPGSFFNADAPAAVSDFDLDGDFDLRDIAALQRAFAP